MTDSRRITLKTKTVNKNAYQFWSPLLTTDEARISLSRVVHSSDWLWVVILCSKKINLIKKIWLISNNYPKRKHIELNILKTHFVRTWHQPCWFMFVPRLPTDVIRDLCISVIGFVGNQYGGYLKGHVFVSVNASNGPNFLWIPLLRIYSVR